MKTPWILLLALPWAGAWSEEGDGEAGRSPGVREELKVPTPFSDPQAVVDTMTRRGAKDIPLAASVRTPKAMEVAGVVTVQEGGRLGFMPLLQHHMAVEHWFLRDMDAAALGAGLAPGSRRYVKLAGQRCLEHYFDYIERPQILENMDDSFWSSGLPHGKDWGGVLGYHERVYTFRVGQVLWVKDEAAFRRHCEDCGRALRDRERLLKAEDFAGALAAHRRVETLGPEVGMGDTEPQAGRFLEWILLVKGDAAAWTPEQAAMVGREAASGDWPFGICQDLGEKAFMATAPGWPEAARARVGAAMAAAWRATPYHAQKEVARRRMRAVGGADVSRLEQDIVEAEGKLADALARMKSTIAASQYRDYQAALEAFLPLRAFLAHYHLADESQLASVRSNLARCLALEAAWGDPARRRETLTATVDALIREGADYRGITNGPSIVLELRKRFLPALDAEGKRDLARHVLEAGGRLNLKEDSFGLLMVGTLMVSVGGEGASEFLEGLLRKRQEILGAAHLLYPGWQQDELRACIGALKRQGR